MSKLVAVRELSVTRIAVSCEDGEAWTKLVETCFNAEISGGTYRIDNWNSAKKEAYYNLA